MIAGKRTCRRHARWDDACGSCTAAMDFNADLYRGTTPSALRALMRTAPGHAR